jgi:hypothetical protein
MAVQACSMQRQAIARTAAHTLMIMTISGIWLRRIVERVILKTEVDETDGSYLDFGTKERRNA